MAIRVRKAADIIEDVVVPTGHRAGEVASVLTNKQPVVDPFSQATWKIELLIGEGPGARLVIIDLPPLLSKGASFEVPIALGESESGRALFFFRDRLFFSDRAPRAERDQEEITLRIKKAVYEEEAELSGLRASVANLEAAIEYQRSGPKREIVPDDVKLVVWARDGGSCVRCGAKQDLQFDHIIPVAMGGGNSEANIQVLCQICNLKKSSKIGVG